MGHNKIHNNIMINKLVIPRISHKFNADAIASRLWDYNLCKVSRILLVPYSDKNENIAYIEVEHWLDYAYIIVPLLENHKPVYVGFDQWELLDSSHFLSDLDTNITAPIKVTLYSEKYFENISQSLFTLASINS